MIDYAIIPPAIRDAIDRWVRDSIPGGHFTMAVLANDLHEAVARADENSLHALHSIVAYVYNEIPSAAWGSPEKLRAWAEHRAEVEEVSHG